MFMLNLQSTYLYNEVIHLISSPLVIHTGHRPIIGPFDWRRLLIVATITSKVVIDKKRIERLRFQSLNRETCRLTFSALKPKKLQTIRVDVGEKPL